MQAIQTKYICPTNFRGSRIRAKCEAMTIFLTWDDALNAEENHRLACNTLCARMDAHNVERYGHKASQWTAPKIAGTLPDGSMVHVFLPLVVA